MTGKIEKNFNYSLENELGFYLQIHKLTQLIFLYFFVEMNLFFLNEKQISKLEWKLEGKIFWGFITPVNNSN